MTAPTPLDLLTLALATWAVIDAWLVGSLFASRRAAVEAVADGPDPPWWATMLACAFCLSYHVPWVLLLGLGLTELACPGLVRWLGLSLAASKLCQLARGLAGGDEPRIVANSIIETGHES